MRGLTPKHLSGMGYFGSDTHGSTKKRLTLRCNCARLVIKSQTGQEAISFPERMTMLDKSYRELLHGLRTVAIELKLSKRRLSRLQEEAGFHTILFLGLN